MAISKILSTILNRSNQTSADFLRIESQVGLTFSGLALALNGEDRSRATEIARNAHDTILRFRRLTDLTDAETTDLDRDVLRLKRELQLLGETF